MAQPFSVSPLAFSVCQTQTIVRKVVRIFGVALRGLAQQRHGLFRFAISHHGQPFSKFPKGEEVKHGASGSNDAESPTGAGKKLQSMAAQEPLVKCTIEEQVRPISFWLVLALFATLRMKRGMRLPQTPGTYPALPQPWVLIKEHS